MPSPLCLLNFVILQWFFIRLARISDKETGKVLGYKMLVGVVPLTGWWSDYVRFWKMW
jgi:hypothetical protein